MLLGGEAFVENMAPQLRQRATITEIPKRQRLLHRPTLKTLLAQADSKALRNEIMARAHLQQVIR